MASNTILDQSFTVCSFNCGGQPLDWPRTAVMEKLMTQRYSLEKNSMSINDKVQKAALFFFNFSLSTITPLDWNNAFTQLHESALDWHNVFEEFRGTSLYWRKRLINSITPLETIPVKIIDPDIASSFQKIIEDLRPEKTKHLPKEGKCLETLNQHKRVRLSPEEKEILEKRKKEREILEARETLAKKIFSKLNYDILCLQEGQYLKSSMFSEKFHVLSSPGCVKLGIAWNKERFDLEEMIYDVCDRAFAVQLYDVQDGKRILIVSAHLKGCDPFSSVVENAGYDSQKGDYELFQIINFFNQRPADINIIGMDSNVTALHHRLGFLWNEGFQLDAENHLYPTCTNPQLMLNTRIDWIAMRINNGLQANITNLKIKKIGLNDPKTNISDHRPIAARISIAPPPLDYLPNHLLQTNATVDLNHLDYNNL
jgi:hypothetical protein